jgi:hypothetical protein
MLFIFILLLYIIGIPLFYLGDAAIGYGVDFDGFETPPLSVVASFWPIAVPILLIHKFGKICVNLKTKRKEKESRKEKIRIALSDEEARAIEDAEKEVEQELRYRRRV